MNYPTKHLTKFMLIAMFLAVLLVMVTLLHQSPLVEAQSGDFAGGSGTEDDPYQIATADQLDKVRNHLNAHFKLIADIELGVSPWNAGEGWEPIGSNSNPFTGTFDGNGYDISNLTINKPTTNYVGLFGATNENAEISNVKLKDVSITSDSYVGALVGLNNGKIENSSATGNVTGNIYVGGLVGYNGGGSITNSYATGDVTGDYYVGGLVGSNHGSITTSYATGVVTGDEYVGGLVGRNAGGSITNTYATGNVTGNSWVGGLVGYNSFGSITTSYATGDVTGNNYVGGLVGRSYVERIENSFALNSAINSTGGNIARIVGYFAGTLNNNYALATMTINGSQISNSNANDKHGADISEQWATTIFPYLEAGWDFTIWQIEEGKYPTLRDSNASAVNPSQPSITTDTGTIVKKDDVFTLTLCGETEATVSTTAEGDTKFFRWMDANKENQSLAASYDVSVGNEYQLEVVSSTGNSKTYDLEVKPGFDLTLQVNDPLGGSISGTAGCYGEGEKVTLEAKTNPGYRFVNWTIDGSEVSDQATFAYTMPERPVTIVANFEILSFNVTAQANIPKAGSVTGSGTYEYGSEVQLKATPNEGYRFVNWTINGKEVSKEPTYSYTVSAEDVEIVANFEILSFNVNAQANIPKAGKVTGSGTYEYGSQITLKATPNEGYRFVNWTVDGKEVSKDQTFTYTVPAEDVEIVANFEILSFKVTAQANIPKAGKVTGGGTYEYESEVTLKATPNEGYRFVNWTVDGKEASKEPTYSYTVPAEDVEIVANFEILSFNVNAQANIPKAGKVTGSGTYEYGSQITLKATPNEGYRFVNWTVDGKEASKEPTYSYTVPAEDVEIVANFEILSFKVTAQANIPKAGKVTGGGTYEYESEVTLKATPNEGYRFVNWTVDGKEASKEPTYSYTVSAEDVEIVANFEAIPSIEEASSEPSSSNLPKTAMNYMKWLIMGLTFLLISIGILIINRKRKVYE